MLEVELVMSVEFVMSACSDVAKYDLCDSYLVWK